MVIAEMKLVGPGLNSHGLREISPK